jgi:hypothetical protein
MELMIMIAAAGATGGLIKSLVEQKGAIALPGIEIAQDGTKYETFYYFLVTSNLVG